ncbi:MAG: TetR family transcriptional regulator [Jatrophihabitans sp.]|jgi:AcrR family transcriptional regulator|nr:TetR family transcriptional regulator [Jatrophihabitans sp.]
MARAGRRPGPTTTPEQILEAARTLFAERGYQGTSMRAVAAAADVNAALVHHYYGTKEQLFVAALRMPLNPAEVITTLLAAGPREEFAQRFVRFFIRAWHEPATGQRLQAVLRSAVSTEQGAASIRTFAEQVLLERVSGALGVSKLRVATAMTHLIGLMLGSTIIGIEPLASASEDELVALVAPVIAGYLDP